MTADPIRTIAEKLREKITLTALETPEFRSLLRDAIGEITGRAKAAATEATIESIFENELYALLKLVNFTFAPQKELAVDTRRHIRQGRIDSKIGGVVIEYKHPQRLKTSKDVVKATRQLRDYLEGLSAGSQVLYFGFLTDGVRCKELIFEESRLSSESALVELTDVQALRLIRNIVLLDRTALTPTNFVNDFCLPGDDSVVIRMTRALFRLLKANPTRKTEMLQLEWEQLFKLGHEDRSQQRMIQGREKALQGIVGERFEAYDQYSALFALQTTYAIVVKLIAYRIISELRFERALKSYHSWLTADDITLRVFCESLENGEVFRDLGIINLLEGDFFSWYADSHQWNHEIADNVRQILGILARYENASEVFRTKQAIDLFQGLYQSIVPQVVRSSLGEFYTPRWLTEHVFASVRPSGSWRGLDPCAGSGTFVLTMIDAVLGELADEPAQVQLGEVLRRVNAIDLNPLAVLTSRINYFIRISHLIPERPSHLQIPVYLGDACYVPEETDVGGVSCLKYSIKTVEKVIRVIVPRAMTSEPQRFSETMTGFEVLVRRCDADKALRLLVGAVPESQRTQEVTNELQRLTEDLVYLEQKGWNGIWSRIISNFLATANLGSFDIIIGNPPWIDWKNLPSGYRERIKSLCVDRKLFSGDGRTGGINLNVCALIASVAIENWLTADGRLAFLMPKVIAFQQSYEGFRKFEFHDGKRGFQGFHDWSKAGHPFDPIRERFMTYVIGSGNERGQSMPVEEFVKKRGARIAGEDHISLMEAMERLERRELLAGQVIPNSTIFSFAESDGELESFRRIAGRPHYIGREGIEFYPQELLLFEIVADPPTTPRKGYVYVRNVQVGKSKYRVPEDTFELETEYLYPLARGTEIEGFKHNYQGLVVPFPYEETDHRRPVSQEHLHVKAPSLLRYYVKYRYILEAQTEYSNRIRGQDAGEFYGLARVGRYSFAEHYVAFRDNTKWCAVVVSPRNTEWGGRKRFVFQNHAVTICEDENKELISADEAHYVCAILNAPVVKAFILRSSDSRSFKIRAPVKVPKYDSSNTVHRELSQLSRQAHSDPQMTEEVLAAVDRLYLTLVD